MEDQAQVAQATNKIIKQQQKQRGWNALMQLGLGMAAGNYGPGGKDRFLVGVIVVIRWLFF